jgi:hypothetical protein
MEVSQKEIRNKSIKNGLFLGLILLVVGIISLYLIASTAALWVVIFAPVVVSFVIPIAVAVFFCLNLRKKVGGYWAFRQATSAIFFMFFTAYVISTLGNFAFGKLVEPNIDQRVKKNLITATTSAMENQGLDQELIDDKVAQIEKQFSSKQQISTGGIIQGVVFSILIVFVFSLIFGAIFKKDPPVYVRQAEE